jgi:hypothetical protein
MITELLNLKTSNDATTKFVSVFATSNTAATETFTFVIIDQTKTIQVTFSAGQSQTVKVSHSASGTGLVKVTVSNSQQSRERILDVDR